MVRAATAGASLGAACLKVSEGFRVKVVGMLLWHVKWCSGVCWYM